MSEEKQRISRPSKDQLADALASMSSEEPGTTPRRGALERPVPATEPQAPDRTDDQTIAPPPTTSDFVRKRPVAHEALERAIATRRTMIPVLLTLGVMLPCVASLKWLSNPESPFASWPTTAVLLLVVTGVVLLLIAVANMLQVRHMMQQRGRRAV